jgi:predicted nucleic acid-binding protein
MPHTAIVDTSCLIALSKLNHLYLLNDLFNKVLTTPLVQKEFGHSLPDWIQISHSFDNNKQNELTTLLDKGEASVIALALENTGITVIIDEKKGRALAKSNNLKTIGTLKVLLVAKQQGIIPAIKPLIQQLQRSNFRLNKNIVQQVLALAYEE